MAIHVVSIHDRHPGGDLAIELRDVLDALGDEVAKHDWIATRFEGGPLKPGTRVDGARLLSAAGGPGVVTDATLFALPPGADCATPTRSGFAGSPARLLVEVVEGAFLVVAAKDQKVVETLRSRFDDVRDEDAEASW